MAKGGQVVISDPSKPNAAIFRDGSFSAAPQKLERSGAGQRLEHCFVGGDGTRVRLALVLAADEVIPNYGTCGMGK
jgi:hypothetical protein